MHRRTTTPIRTPLRRRALTGVAVASALALALTACSAGGSPSTSTADLPSASEMPTVTECAGAATATIWSLQNSQAQADLDSAMAAAYAKQCPGTKIQYQYYPANSLNEKVTTILASGTPPTAIEPTDPAAMEQYVHSGALLDAGKLLKTADPDWESKFLPSALDVTKLDDSGEVYGFPTFGASPITLWWNKDVFKKVGLTHAPTTLAELDADVQKLKKASIIPVALGDQDKAPSDFWAQYLVEREGGSAPFQSVRDGKTDAWSDPAIIEGLTQLQQLSKDGAFGTGFDSTGDQNGADRALFYSGKAAMMLAPANFLSKISAIDPDFVKSGAVGYAQFPSGKQSERTVDGNASVNFFVTAKSSKASQQLLASYFTTMLSSEAYAKGEASVGVVPAVADADQYIPDTVAGKAVSWAYELASKEEMNEAWTTVLIDNDTVLEDNTAAIVSRTVTPRQFATTMNKTIG